MPILISLALAASAAVTATPVSAGRVRPDSTAAEQPTSVDQALTRAQRAGSPVEVTAAGTSSQTLTANPDGTLTVNQAATPYRKRVDGAWQPLDATLVHRPDGSIGPVTTTHEVAISAGGTGPMATMTSGDRSLALSIPAALPAPTLSGPNATYSDVQPGVDLQVKVTREGGFSHVFVVRNAAAAATFQLDNLTLTTETQGFNLATDQAGNITGQDRSGKEVIFAPAPTMWDSSAATATSARTIKKSAATRGARSTARAAGTSAKVARLGVTVSPGKIALSPDRKLLTGPETVYPVFIDPTFEWASTSPPMGGWATINHDIPSTNYWKNTPDPYGRMQVGNSGVQWSHTLINFPMHVSILSGATISSATFKITNTLSYSCTPSTVNLYAPSTTLTSGNAYWNYWKNVSYGSAVATKSFAHGRTGCPAAAESFDITPEVTANVANNKATQTLILTGVNEATDVNSWKEFLETSPTLEIRYNHRPNKPTGMTTSPKTSCAAATPTVVGDGTVSLYTPVSDRNGGTLGVSFKLWKSADTNETALASSNPTLLTRTSGSTAVLIVPVTTLRTAAGTQITDFSWKVQTTDFSLTSDWSDPCEFSFDPTRTGAPGISQPTGQPTIGQPTTFTISPPTTGGIPARYMYQLNAGPPVDIAADTNGNGILAVAPTRFTNTLSVTSVSPGGNAGDTESVTFNAAPAATATDADLTGDSVADLLTVGSTHDLPAGLWLAPGTDDGTVSALPSVAGVNIGARGNGVTGNNSPADFNGGQAVTGRFTGTGIQDVLVYYPTGTNAGAAGILRANGDGSIIQAQLDGNQLSMYPQDLFDDGGLSPLQVANAGNTRRLPSAVVPDLIGTSGNTVQGYYLTYYANFADMPGFYMGGTRTSATTPTGGTDWNNWTITTAQMATGTAMFLWNPTTKNLYLWTNLTFNPGTTQLTYTPYLLHTNWAPNAGTILRAADINTDGTPDLWTVGAAAATTPQLVTNLTTGTPNGTGTITAQSPRTVITSDHTWQLNNAADGPVTTAQDSTGTLDATGNSGVTWSSGDAFDPDAVFNGTTGTLVTNAPAVATNNSFTVSAWIKPITGGTILSQDGTQTAGFKLWAEASDKSWRFAMPRTDATSPTFDTISAGTNSLRWGVWTHITANYNKDINLMTLYIDGANVARGTHSTVWNATAGFRIGSHKTTSSTYAGYFGGELAFAQTWDQAWNIADAPDERQANLLATKTDGSLWYYPNSGVPEQPFGYGNLIGSSWTQFDKVMSADLNNDSYADIIARKPDGGLWYYPNSIAINPGKPYGTGQLIGTGWADRVHILCGDINGDGYADLVTTNAAGDLRFYTNNYANNPTAPFSGNGNLIGTGWTTYTRLMIGDINDNGYADMIGTLSNGDLKYFNNNYATSPSNPFTGNGNLIGTGWGSFDRIVAGDVSGDGYVDLTATKPDGSLWLYSNRLPVSSQPYGYGKKIGTGWTIYNRIF